MNWQLKETAPMDGTIVLVAHYNQKHPKDLWPLSASYREIGLTGKPEWRDKMGNKINFTHWCPIQTPDEKP